MIRWLLITLLLVAILPMAMTKASAEGKYKKATFAGGCFWCMEHPFEELSGVIEVISGFSGGHKKDPTYAEVTSGKTGHIESVQITYDPAKVSYNKLLEVFWRQIDPTDAGGQFVDRGYQYSTAIFFHTETQRIEAAASLASLNASGRYTKPIVTKILKAGDFYRAEEYHQDYYKKSTIKYKFYRYRSGRDQFLSKVWSEDRIIKDKTSGTIEASNTKEYNEAGYTKPSDKELKERLTSIQYRVTQKDGTERSFKNAYWDNKEEGIYVDIVSDEPLFSSLDKFVSGTGWPSFSRPLEANNIIEREDKKIFVTRTEVRSRYGDSHLGHLFDDGPEPTGLRYCINSAALRFIPKANLEADGYEEYKKLFD